MKSKAFTLIELLIVVAIIAILAAIAVPNFLEAQTRSKVSRTLADMRSMATAAESYYVDYNRYSPSWAWKIGEEGMRRWTTPVAYITSVPSDIFRPESFRYGGQIDPPGGSITSTRTGAVVQDNYFDPTHFGYMTLAGNTCEVCWLADYGRFSMRPDAQQANPAATLGVAEPGWFPAEDGWQIRSLGPDQVDSFQVPYDPTNGTISNGEITRWGPTNETTQ